MKVVAFFNNDGGIGKTTLVYHLACMMAERGETVLAVDLDPLAYLTSMFLRVDELEQFWLQGEHEKTIFGALRTIARRLGDVGAVHVQRLSPRLGLIVGDIALSTFEYELSLAWASCLSGDESAFRTTTAFYRGMRDAAQRFEATWVLVDVGSNLGAISRAALIASEYVVLPLRPDLYSLQGLRSLGPSLATWRKTWMELERQSRTPTMELPGGLIEPLGYVVMQQDMRESRPPTAYQRWIERFPVAYRESVLEQSDGRSIATEEDPYCLAVLKHHRSLMPMAMEARKPVFALKPADGAIGAHGEAVRNAYQDFLALARRIAECAGAVVN